MPVISPGPYTKTLIIGEEAKKNACKFFSEEFSSKKGLVVCDENTEFIAGRDFPDLPRMTFEGGAVATDINGDAAALRLSEGGFGFAVACGSGSISDITRYAAAKAGIPFVSYPTAASMDGFVSSVAAMTIDGRKVTLPSKAPVALFADPSVFSSAPLRLTLSGVGDILGKYISLFDWRAAHYLMEEVLDDKLIDLINRAIDKMLALDPEDAGFSIAVMEGLVMTGMTIQYHGSSRAASGAEHHLSHLWEMHCMSEPTDALHGEKVGVSTLIVLERYKSVPDEDLAAEYIKPEFTRENLFHIYGSLTDGIIAENTPDPLASLTREKIKAAQPEINRMVKVLPDTSALRDYMKKIGALTTLDEIGLENTARFKNLSMKYAPYVRRRITLLKILNIKD
ncbi:MAG TPA: sn-glycerol-1-phosphate dehydrogenase [Clostridiales bacterium]|nr:sn-glycerol-1-phosphate dehydrogenase [Clostridiales bacterium]